MVRASASGPQRGREVHETSAEHAVCGEPSAHARRINAERQSGKYRSFSFTYVSCAGEEHRWGFDVLD